jgi:flagellar biosynthesis GTPase FlhF
MKLNAAKKSKMQQNAAKRSKNAAKTQQERSKNAAKTQQERSKHAANTQQKRSKNAARTQLHADTRSKTQQNAAKTQQKTQQKRSKNAAKRTHRHFRHGPLHIRRGNSVERVLVLFIPYQGRVGHLLPEFAVHFPNGGCQMRVVEPEMQQNAAKRSIKCSKTQHKTLQNAAYLEIRSICGVLKPPPFWS